MPRKAIESFQIDYLQVLDENGNVDEQLDPRIPAEELRVLYKMMLKARLVDKRMVQFQQQGRIGTFPGVYGQEGGCLGYVYALLSDDWLCQAFRETSALFWRGVPIKNILMYFMGMEEGNVFPESAWVLPVPIAIGSQTLHAAGIAMGMKLRGDDKVVMTFFGDGATSVGDFHEACNMAGVYKAPVIFVCINNQFAISVPREIQTSSQTLAQKAVAYGFPGIQVDGNDILGAYVAGKEAVERARRGDGPTLIESVTYRLCAHTTADDPRRYRSEEEVEEWKKRDPILRFQRYLENKGLWRQQWQEQLEESIRAEIDEAMNEAEAELRNIDPLEMFDHVYEELPAELAAQREQAAELIHDPVKVS